MELHVTSQKECRITPEDVEQGPAHMTAKLKAAGFVFEREGCPVVLAREWTHERDGDGWIYRQRLHS